jgi:hypothetical protein
MKPNPLVVLNYFTLPVLRMVTVLGEVIVLLAMPAE